MRVASEHLCTETNLLSTPHLQVVLVGMTTAPSGPIDDKNGRYNMTSFETVGRAGGEFLFVPYLVLLWVFEAYMRFRGGGAM